MSVNAYNINKCAYQKGGLKPQVLLLPKDTTKIAYNFDGLQCSVDNIEAEEVIKLKGFSCTANVTESTGNRLAFDSVVELKTMEQWSDHWISLLKVLKDGLFYVVVEDENGSRFIQSPEFTSELNYSYTFSSATTESHNATITLSVSSNFPLTYIGGNIELEETTSYGEECAYNVGTVEKFWMSARDYALVEADSDYYTFSKITTVGGEQLHEVGFIPGSFSFTEEWDGSAYRHTLQFQIPLSEYKHYFRYNLVEFQENLYAVMFRTTVGNHYATGFTHGLQPTYTVETSESVDELNLITITLQEHTNDGLLYHEGDAPDIENSDTGKYIPARDKVLDPVTGEWLGYYHCIDRTTAIYTLLQMVTETGRPVDRYICLEGYADLYRNINIVGTYSIADEFDFDLVFENNDCAAEDNCKFTRLSDTIFTFTGKGDKRTLTIKSDCPWELGELPSWISADMTNGAGGMTYELTFACLEDATGNDALEDVATISSFDNVAWLTFILQGKKRWVNPYEHHIDARAQSVFTKVSLDWDDYEICEAPEDVKVEKVYGQGGVRITVPENGEEVQRAFRVKLCSKRLGDEAVITVIQDRIYLAWKVDRSSVICVGEASYEKLVGYKGYEEGKIDIPTGETKPGGLISSHDSRCMGMDEDLYREQWVEDGEAICDGRNLYMRERLHESFDGGVFWIVTNRFRLGRLVEENSEKCSFEFAKMTKWLVDNSRHICDGTDSYYAEVLHWSYNGDDWYISEPLEERKSEILYKKDDPLCGGIQPEPGYEERWEDTVQTECIDGLLHYLQRKSWSDDGGQTWHQTDEYRPVKFEPNIYCSEIPERFKVEVWVVNFDKLVCVGYNQHYVEVKCYYYRDEPDVIYVDDPYEERASDIVKEENSKECGYEGPTTEPIYRWNPNTGKADCDGSDLRVIEDEEVSNDGGKTWEKTGDWRYGEVLEKDSEACKEEVERIYSWIIDYYRWVCVGSDSFYLAVKQFSDDGGRTWEYVTPEETMPSEVLKQKDDSECKEEWRLTDDYICVEDEDEEYVEPDDYELRYLTMEFLEEGKFYTNQDGIKYSVNGGSWKDMVTNEEIPVSTGDKIRFKKNSFDAYFYEPQPNWRGAIFRDMPPYNLYGNINSMYAGDDFTSNRASLDNMFDYWFYFTNVVDASNLVLPYDNLGRQAFRSFMANCKLLEKAPVLPARTAKSNSCDQMFGGCPKLDYIKCLETKSGGTSISYNQWLYGVSETGTFVKRKGANWVSGPNGIPQNWEIIEIE